MKNYIPVFLFCLLVSQVHGQLAWRQEVNTAIEVTLNPLQRTLDAFLTMEYINHSPDTLRYIWLQLCPNAFKNDRTAFSEQWLKEGRTDFYFSDKEQKGYINQLSFRTGNNILQQEDHPQYIDIIKVYLSAPLAPQQGTIITTPFHVQLPKNFSGLGYAGGLYELAHWYPTPSVYDSAGWHPVPYTGQKETTNEYGTMDMQITLPVKYHIIASGNLVDSSFQDSLKTMHYRQGDVNHFTWMADSNPFPVNNTIASSNLNDRLQALYTRLSAKPVLPAAGYNEYDGLQVGLLFNNYNAARRLKYFAVPLYAFNSKRLTGLGGINYSWYPNTSLRKIEAGVNGSAFSTIKGRDTLGKKVFGNFYKIAPYIKISFSHSSVNVQSWLRWKTYILGEKGLQYTVYSVDSFYYPSTGRINTRYLNELTYYYGSGRVLYPYHIELQAQQARDFYRLNAEVHYFFNYADGGGMRLRWFASKFGYIGATTSEKKFDTWRYQPKLTAVRGDEDYTYGNYFLGRNEPDGLAAQQMMMRDGGLKLRTDLFQDLQGRSDNWISSVNLNTTLPQVFPVKIPLRVFLDIGTYADAWKYESSQPRFLYVAGLQLSLFNDLLNIYAPLIFSKEFRDSFKTVPEENKFIKRISFSVNIQRFSLFKFSGNKSPV